MESERRTEAHEEKLLSRNALIRRAQNLATEGYSNVAIAQELGISEATVRSLLKEQSSDR